MCIETLRELSAGTRPQTFSSGRMIDELRVLRAAGLVAVLVLRAGPSEPREVARFLAITPAGYRALRTCLAPGDEPTDGAGR